MIRKSIISAALAAGLVSLPAVSSAQVPEVGLQFMTFPMTVEPMAVELLLGEGKTVEILVPSNELSPVVRVPRMSNLVFGETITNDENETSFKIYGQGKPTSAPRQLVLLLRKGKDMSNGIEVRAISSNIQEFAGGKLLFVNAATTDVAGEVGGKPFALKPGQQRLIEPKKQQNGRLAEVKFWYSKDNEAVPFFNSVWPVSDDFRGLIFFYNDPTSQNKIQLHSFRDFIADE